MPRGDIKKAVYRDIHFDEVFLKRLLAEDICKFLADYYIRVVGRQKSLKQSKYRSKVIAKLKIAKATVLSVEEFQGDKNMQLVALAEALRIIDAICSRRGQHPSVYACSIYACAYVAYENDIISKLRKFYKEHLRQEVYDRKMYLRLHQLRPNENKALRDMIKKKLDEWREGEEVREKVMRVLEEGVEGVIEEFSGQNMLRQIGSGMDAAAVLYCIAKRHNLKITLRFIADEFGVTELGLRLRARKLGMLESRTRIRRNRKTKAR